MGPARITIRAMRRRGVPDLAPVRRQFCAQNRHTVLQLLAGLHLAAQGPPDELAQWHIACVDDRSHDRHLRGPAPPRDSAWTCPFCPLACDHLGVAVGAGSEPLALQGGECAARQPRAGAVRRAGLRRPRPQVDGQPCDLDQCRRRCGAACSAPAGSRCSAAWAPTWPARARCTGWPARPARSATPARGEALMHGLRALQDRGQFTTTLAEVRTRADLIVFVGGVPIDAGAADRAALRHRRCAGAAAPCGRARAERRATTPLLSALGRAGRCQRRDGAAAGRPVRHASALLCALVDQRAVPAAPGRRCAAWRSACARRAMPCSSARRRGCRRRVR